jgi:glycosyltransferase involved in cell wall biosynthesis
MKIVALLNIFNEELIIGQSLAHLHREGIYFYIIDNGSADRTMEIVDTFRGKGLVGCEYRERQHEFDYIALMRRKVDISRSLSADWFIHYDADEFRTSNIPDETLAQAITRIDQLGYNAINFQEFTFIPTREHPQHHAESFVTSMKWYYPFLPSPLHRLNAWKAGVCSLDLESNAGHRISFDGMRIYPESLWLRHYLYINRDQFTAKYSNRKHRQCEIERGWHGWREKAGESLFFCPPESAMRMFDLNKPWLMDSRDPLARHMLETAGCG